MQAGVERPPSPSYTPLSRGLEKVILVDPTTANASIFLEGWRHVDSGFSLILPLKSGSAECCPLSNSKFSQREAFTKAQRLSLLAYAGIIWSTGHP